MGTEIGLRFYSYWGGRMDRIHSCYTCRPTPAHRCACSSTAHKLVVVWWWLGLQPDPISVISLIEMPLCCFCQGAFHCGDLDGDTTLIQGCHHPVQKLNALPAETNRSMVASMILRRLLAIIKQAK